jgi:tight adherence protein C
MTAALGVRAWWILIAAPWAVAIGALTYALGGLSSAKSPVLGIRGYRRTRALANRAWATCEPLVRWAGARLRPLIPPGVWTTLDRQLAAAGDTLGLLPEEYLASSVLSAAAGTLVGLALKFANHQSQMVVTLSTAAGAVLPVVYVINRGNYRRKRVGQGLPYVIDVLSLGLSAGLDFLGCLRQVVDKASDPDDPLIEELALILRELQLGKTRSAALTLFAARIPVESTREFVNAVLQSEERGNPLAEVLAIQAVSSRQRRSTRAEEMAAKAGLKLIVPCLLMFGCVMILIAAPLLLSARSTFAP